MKRGTMQTQKSTELFKRAQKVLPGGVNSPVRAFKSVGRDPLFIQRANGSKMWDVDGNMYIDYVGSWGPMLFGHAHPDVVESVKHAAEGGLSFGAPAETEVLIGELICEMIPSIDVVRMVNSGTEATMSAIRLARAYTKRDKIVKFEGCYHGHADSFLIKAGSGALTLGSPDSPGVTGGTARDTLTAQFNDTESVKALFENNKDSIAAVIIEPVAGNMGCIPPSASFLQDIRDICTENNALLIFDEVMTGFRLSRGGAQELYGIRPDLTTLGKVIGGGMPVGAYGGRHEIMSLISPSGPVYQAGTLSGNPIAMASGYTMLSYINEHMDIYDKLEKKGAALEDGIRGVMSKHSYPLSINRVGSMFTLFFTDREVTDFITAESSDKEKFARYFGSMLEQGIYLPPSQFEAAFISTAHSDGDIEKTVSAVEVALAKVFG
jgi:glutamate-1-semialdehyde 2,1-aminomutase